jgi:hypothetical protein
MMAITNQMSLQQGGFNLGFLNPLLYQIANDSTMYADSFHDITAGSNDLNNQNSGSYPATTGYDMATGLGSYNAAHLAEHLVSIAHQTQKQRMSPANTTWYFAEGSVGGGFQEYLTLQNPSTTQDAQVNVSYLFQSRAPITVQHTVSRSSRATISANADLGIGVSAPQQAISAVVEVLNESPGIVVERPMYFHYRAVQSGTDVLGATSPSSSYYFPNVDTRQNGRAYYTYITMLNPSHTQNATATVTYYTGSCGQAGQVSCPTQRIVIPPMHRGTATPLTLSLYQQMAASVQSDQPLVVERPMYFRDTIAAAGGFTTGAASVVGATTPGSDWLFAEGYTGTNFQENLLLANFGTSSTTATLTLQFSNGHTQAVGVTVPALSQYNVDVRQVKSSLAGTCDTSPCSPTSEASIEVRATAPIVAERLMYFHYGAGKYSGATETVGEAGPASHYLYAFAEGYTANSFNEYLTLQNPTASDETAVITLFADTYVFQQTVSIKAHSRYTVFINPLVVPIAQNYNNIGSNSYSVSLTVQALGTNALLVAERPMYFNYYGDQGGTDIIGFTG